MTIYSRLLCVALAMFALPVAAQICNPKIRETAPATRFAVHADGTVTDTRTGLMWKRCVEGLSGTDCATGGTAFNNWSNALTLAANSTYAGYSDWRLPNPKELESLVEYRCMDPAINLTVFPGTPRNWHWTAAPYANASDYAWIGGFYVGGSSYDGRTIPYAVRLVRDMR